MSASQSSAEEETAMVVDKTVDPKRSRFPFCIVWTPLPCITALLPMIGHTGICTADGVIHDFAGPYYVSVDDFAFGKPTKYLQLDVRGIDTKTYDLSIQGADSKFGNEMHNIFCNNCHSHVADALNRMRYRGKTDWTMLSVWWQLCVRSKYVSTGAFIKTYLGFLIVILVVILLAIFL
eukprot:GILK01008901.1.p1 GENE.GILK01008901.1~~GILK01008901.1.p1  ORF type:complete len:189 (+),score=11.13 GILK01008901.1:36-569(+)